MGKCFYYVLTHDSVLDMDMIFGPFLSHDGALAVAEKSLNEPFKIETFGEEDKEKARAYFAPRFSMLVSRTARKASEKAATGRSTLSLALLLVLFFIASAAVGFGLCMIIQP